MGDAQEGGGVWWAKGVPTAQGTGQWQPLTIILVAEEVHMGR